MARILVVDDDVELQKVIRGSLVPIGHEVVAAVTGEDALRAAVERSPDLAVIDLKLPGIDGLGCFRRMKERRPSLSGIVLTGYPSYPSVVDALRCGIADYLEKPIRAWQLVAAIDRALGGGHVASAGAKDPPEPNRRASFHRPDDFTPRSIPWF
jgi:DNA-binding NtrC family response regulator